MVLPADVVKLIEINHLIGRQLHLIKLCRACIVQVSEKLVVPANMLIECHHFDLLNTCCWFPSNRFRIKFDCSMADFYK